jgi:hypothetical protein
MAAAEIIPNPDPSQKTDQAIDKAVSSAAAVLTARIDGIEKSITKFQEEMVRVPTTMDRAIEGLRDLVFARLASNDADRASIHSTLDRREKDIREQITHLHDLVISKIEELASVTTERFIGVAAQFSERDTRTDQRAGDTKLAVDAAFAAAKEATAKIEAGFTKQIDAMINIIDTKTANLAGGLGDIKDRMTAMENRTVGITSAKDSSRNESGDSRANIAIVISFCAVVVLILLHFLKLNASPP